MKTYQWELVGLDCANCAAKIEHAVEKLSGITHVSMNFMQRKLCFSAEDSMRTVEVRDLIQSIEPGVQIREQSQKNSAHQSFLSGDMKLMVGRILIASILFLTGSLLTSGTWARTVLLLAAYLTVGVDIIWRAVKNIAHGSFFDENFLMALATIGALFIGQFPEAAGVMLFYQIGELFQSAAVARSRRSIRELMDIRPDYANLQLGSDIEKRSPSEIHPGDVIVIRPGERIPLDAVVISGSSTIDTAALTGESIPRPADAGTPLISGCVNLSGVLTARVTHDFSESTASRVLDLVENATAKKAKSENFITKFARYYTPAVVVAALCLACIPPLFVGNFSNWLYRALVFLVISCPCALVISIPLTFFCGIGGASRLGILVKGSNYLDALARVETVVFDKTGTLTRGIFCVRDIGTNDITKEQLLEYAALAESASLHPVAASIRNAYGKALDSSRVTDIQEIPGRGVVAKIDGKVVLAGNGKLLSDKAVSFPVPETEYTTVLVAVDGKYVGFLSIADEIKSDSALAIQKLHANGIKKTVMLTGDRKSIADDVASALGLDAVHAELLPADKLTQIESLLPEGTLAFVGDGINDAPALARADVGIAMGGLGTDAAMEAADVVLMTDEPSRLVSAIQIARKTRRIVWQNIIFTLVIKALFLLLGAFGVASMWEAVFADVGVCALAILNAVRAMKTLK